VALTEMNRMSTSQTLNAAMEFIFDRAQETNDFARARSFAKIIGYYEGIILNLLDNDEDRARVAEQIRAAAERMFGNA